MGARISIWVNRNVSQRVPVGLSSRLFPTSVCLNTLRVVKEDRRILLSCSLNKSNN